MSEIIVIGGGAAGLMAAYAAADHGANVRILEKNEKFGKKIYITGKGRCNFTNACDREEFFPHLVSNPKFMYSAFYGFDNQNVMDLFAREGMPYKIERGDRVFPRSDHASDVTATLVRLCRDRGVKMELGCRVRDLVTCEEAASFGQTDRKDAGSSPQELVTQSPAQRRVTGLVLEDGREYGADGVILATGGLSYPSTGATGDGYRMAAGLGHSLREPIPALVPMTVEEKDLLTLQGLSLRNVSFCVLGQTGKKLYEGFGEMLFTHFGISGPLILSASSILSRRLRREKRLSAEIDLKSALTREELDLRLQREIRDKINKSYKNLFGGLLPSKLIPLMIVRTGIDPDRKMHEISREERARIVHCLKHFPLTLTGTGSFSEAIITQGGICVREINPSTMESKLVKGLYLAGEIIDVDALTGGFNLQLAWSTGYLAGMSAAESQQGESRMAGAPGGK